MMTFEWDKIRNYSQIGAFIGSIGVICMLAPKISWVSIVFYIVAALFFDTAISLVAEGIAIGKGHKDFPAFLMCFILGPFGWLAIIALPDLYARVYMPVENSAEPISSEPDSNKSEKDKTSNESVINEPSNAASNLKTCPECGARIGENYKFCIKCGYKF